MAASATGVLSPDDLNRTDKEVLGVLAGGRVTPRFVADELDVSRTYASERLKRLVEHSHVEKVAPGLYELVDDPRDPESYDVVSLEGVVTILVGDDSPEHIDVDEIQGQTDHGVHFRLTATGNRVRVELVEREAGNPQEEH